MRYWPIAAYIGSIVLANIAIVSIGMVPVGLGLVAPAGVYVVGLSFYLRDLVQDRHGRRTSILAIAIGAAVSALLSPALALASGTAFLLSELLDMAVYTPLRQRNLYCAVLASNSVGLVVDSAVFLLLAFGSLDYLAGQVVGKAWMTLAVLAVLAIVQPTAKGEQSPG